jgi:hypothetical protein
MIVQLINNVSWASLLVSECKNWKRESLYMAKERSTVKDKIRKNQVETKGAKVSNV